MRSVEAMGSTAVASDHDITPVRGSARGLDGSPADLLKPSDYPIEAICLECGQPIRAERYYLSEWVHILRFTNPPAS